MQVLKKNKVSITDRYDRCLITFLFICVDSEAYNELLIPVFVYIYTLKHGFDII